MLTSAQEPRCCHELWQRVEQRRQEEARDRGPSHAPPANTPAPTRPQVDIMTEKIYGNMAAAHIKLGNWRRAEETADACLKKNPENTKALFRRAKALGEQGFWDRAEPLFQDLLKKSPAEAPSIHAELKRLGAIDKEREKAARQKMKGACACCCVYAGVWLELSCRLDEPRQGRQGRGQGRRRWRYARGAAARIVCYDRGGSLSDFSSLRVGSCPLRFSLCTLSQYNAFIRVHIKTVHVVGH
jgi:tetratricopeptide (TPR) repeat protein